MGMDNGQRRADAENGLGNVTRTPFMDVIVEEELRHAQPGEMGIFARSGHIPVGYFNDPVKTAKTFVTVEGKRWLLTGDSARLEMDGSITVFGRGSSCINSGGEKIFPEEVEEAVKRVAGVIDCLVVGVDDDKFGQAVTAVASLAAGTVVTEAEVMAAVHRELAGFKAAKRVVFVAEVPRAPNGKADYKAAKALATEAIA